MEATNNNKRTVIITFKPKDKRSTKIDKQEIVKSSISSRIDFLTVESFTQQVRPVSSGRDLQSIGYDVNRYEAPVLIANLTSNEVDSLRKNPDVESVEEDGTMHALDVDRSQLPASLGVPRGVEQVRAPQAWPSSQGEGIKVFVADTGIDSDHPSLKANLRLGKSFVTTESSTEDFHGHGTHVAGTIGAAFNPTGVVGVAPYAYLYPLKVLSANGSGKWSWMIAALDWVMDKKGPRIVNMSLGGANAPEALQNMCKAAYADGVLLIAAAGNSGPADDTVNCPAKYKSVVAVSAINGTGTIADFSSRGPEVEICAPGVDILSTTRGGGTGEMSGTSMACPHVAGVSALVWGAHRSCNNKQVRWLVSNFADAVGDRDSRKYGKGRVDANQSAFFLGAVPEFE